MKNIFYDKSKIDYGNLLFPRRALWMLLMFEAFLRVNEGALVGAAALH